MADRLEPLALAQVALVRRRVVGLLLMFLAVPGVGAGLEPLGVDLPAAYFATTEFAALDSGQSVVDIGQALIDLVLDRQLLGALEGLAADVTRVLVHVGEGAGGFRQGVVQTGRSLLAVP